MTPFQLPLLIAAFVSALAAGAHAQSTTTTAEPTGDAYYVVQETTSKRCLVTMTKPSGPTVVVLGGDATAYRTRAEAEDAMKEINLCR
jgi:hypothetical protein